MTSNPQDFLISFSMSVRDTMKRLNQVEGQALYVVDEGGRLLGSVTDGDIRRYLMNGNPAEHDISEIYTRNPVRIRIGYRSPEVRRLMQTHKIESVPVVDADDRVVEVLLWETAFRETGRLTRRKLDVPVIIMAGGKGTRMDPFTRILPKPLVPIDDRPVIELVIERFLAHGLDKFFLSVNHKSRILKAYFEEANPQYRIRWIEEDKPLGTAGGLRFLEGKINGPFFVSNCDIIVNADLAGLFEYHQARQNEITIVASLKRYPIPYGLCEIENDGTLIRLREKPEYDLLVNIGLYVVNDSALRWIPPDQYFDFTDLIVAAKQKSAKVGVYPIEENDWIDVGQWEVYRNAIKVFQGHGGDVQR
ncbi:MAG: NTP transferase domain-containing protein [Phycisphaerae bacterium]|nr:NTP transferase domain-containing protein [Phycisphaerae bacterium]